MLGKRHVSRTRRLFCAVRATKDRRPRLSATPKHRVTPLALCARAGFIEPARAFVGGRKRMLSSTAG
ncbi:hypothetical protein XHC_1520 [Xanthomonas hortorum pv. carotae str. M081]|nr:hypothetical protein XHC_1520 [Xanthomonas hortorum pv. carotae str. M081]